MKASAIKRKLQFSSVAMRKSAVELQQARATSEQLQQRIAQHNKTLHNVRSAISALDRKLDALIAAGGWQLHQMLQVQLHEALSQQDLTEMQLRQLQHEQELILQQGVSLKLQNSRLTERTQQYSTQYSRLQSRKSQRLSLAGVI